MVQTSKIQMDFLTQFQDEIRRLFKNFFEKSKVFPTTQGSQILPQADVFETDAKLVVNMDLPGVSVDDIEVSVSRDLIVVEGCKKENTAEGKGSNYICVEREFGRFRKIIEIPIPGDTNNIKANLKNGMLSISIPKLKDRRSVRKKVTIETT